MKCMRCKVLETGSFQAYLYTPYGYRKYMVCDPCHEHLEKVQVLEGADAPVERLDEGMDRVKEDE